VKGGNRGGGILLWGKRARVSAPRLFKWVEFEFPVGDKSEGKKGLGVKKVKVMVHGKKKDRNASSRASVRKAQGKPGWPRNSAGAKKRVQNHGIPGSVRSVGRKQLISTDLENGKGENR